MFHFKSLKPILCELPLNKIRKKWHHPLDTFSWYGADFQWTHFKNF